MPGALITLSTLKRTVLLGVVGLDTVEARGKVHLYFRMFGGSLG